MVDIDNKMRFLLLSNDGDNIKFMIRSLNAKGFNNISAMENGLEALKVMADEPYEFIIVDNNTSLLNGWLFVKELKTSDRIQNTPIILFGKEECPVDPKELKQFGIIQYFRLPSTASKLDYLIISSLSIHKTSGTTEYKHSQAKSALMENNPTEAEDIYHDLRAVTDKDVRSSLGLAQAYTQGEKEDEANDVMVEIVESGDDSPTTLIIGMELFLKQGNLEKATDAKDKLLEVTKEQPFYFERAATMFLENKQHDISEAICRDAILKKFSMPEFHILLAKSAALQKNIGEALKLIDQAQRKFGASKEMLNLKGICLRRSKEYEKAIQCYEETLAISPMDARVYFNLSLCSIAMNNTDEAIHYLEMAVKISPDFEKASKKLTELRG